MPGMKAKAGIAGMVMVTGYMIITTQPNNEARAASCPDLPKVTWWKTNHEKIVKYVDQRYNGDWESYLTKWRNYRNKMKTIFEKDGTAIVKSRGLRLKGAKLKKHIGDVEKRILVTQCLKQKHGGRLASRNSLDGSSISQARRSLAHMFQVAKEQALQFASKPGIQQVGVSAMPIWVEGSTYGVTGEKLNLEISAKCVGLLPVFRVTNLGDQWPHPGAINIYQTDGRTMVTKKSIRLSTSQNATFKVFEKGKSITGEVGVWIQPSWTNRPFQYDSRITCSS